MKRGLVGEDDRRGRRQSLLGVDQVDLLLPLAEEPEAPKEAEVVDLVAALRASVEAAKKRREEAESAKAVLGPMR